MKPRIRSLMSLWFRFGQGTTLDSVQIADALSNAKLIERVNNYQYRDTEFKPKLSKSEYEARISDALAAYKAQGGAK